MAVADPLSVSLSLYAVMRLTSVQSDAFRPPHSSRNHPPCTTRRRVFPHQIRRQVLQASVLKHILRQATRTQTARGAAREEEMGRGRRCVPSFSGVHHFPTGVPGSPIFVPRVLDVEKGQLCFIIGTVYMDMPLKPNVLEDIARDVSSDFSSRIPLQLTRLQRSIPAPPPREKYHSENDNVMLEDESGRICLVGERLDNAGLVTGVIMGALGIETNNGDFEVVDICFPGMAPQPSAGLAWPAPKKSDESMDVDGKSHCSFDGQARRPPRSPSNAIYLECYS